MLTKREIIIIVIVFFMGVLGLLYYFNFREVEDEHTVTGLKIPDRVQAYTGIVREVTPQYIKIDALSQINYLPEDTRLRVDIMEDTKITRYTLAKFASYDDKVPQLEEVPIQASEITVGDTVEAHAKANIKGRLMFPADTIRVIEF